MNPETKQGLLGLGIIVTVDAAVASAATLAVDLAYGLNHPSWVALTATVLLVLLRVKKNL